MTWKRIVVVLRRLGAGEVRLLPIDFAGRLALAAGRLRGSVAVHEAALASLCRNKAVPGAVNGTKESRA